jgi:UDP-3-O-[3-hydroxymyristoyl] glucosamine N-acyltransferase
LRVGELAAFLRAEYEGDGELEISGAAPVESARSSDLSFASGAALARVDASQAGCLIVPPDFSNVSGRSIIRAEQPRGAFAAALQLIYPPEPLRAGVHPSASIAASASVDTTCEIGPYVTIGDRASIGRGTRIGAGCSIGADVRVGADCSLAPNVTIYSRVEIGSHVILHSGVVLGADGFGFIMAGDHWEKFPQVGFRRWAVSRYKMMWRSAQTRASIVRRSA